MNTSPARVTSWCNWPNRTKWARLAQTDGVSVRYAVWSCHRSTSRYHNLNRLSNYRIVNNPEMCKGRYSNDTQNAVTFLVDISNLCTWVTRNKYLVKKLQDVNCILYRRWRFGAVGSDVGQINEVTLRRARLVLGWVTVWGFNSSCGKFISVWPTTQVNSAWPSLRG